VIDPDVEVAKLPRAGWGFRCHRCDITEADLDEATARNKADRHVHRERWQLDIPQVPDHVTALSGAQDTLWLRQGPPPGFDAWGGSWWACQFADGKVGPTVHITDIVSHAPLVETVDPRGAE